MLYDKIEQAKCGATVTIYPDELHDPFYPLTIADLISMCDTYHMPYTQTDSPPTFTISPPTQPMYISPPLPNS